MNITAIYGSEKKGSTYTIAQLFLKEMLAEIGELTEFFLPRDMGVFCAGCNSCFTNGEQYCPGSGSVEPIVRAIDQADLVVFTSPVYAMRASGQMKALLDHLAFLYMTHRPLKSMFSKTALVVSTGAGGGTKAASKDIATSLRFWGAAKIHRYGAAVFAGDWAGVSAEKKRAIEAAAKRRARKIGREIGSAKPGAVTKALFAAFRLYHKKFGYCERDVAYWRENGWLEKARPWR